MTRLLEFRTYDTVLREPGPKVTVNPLQIVRMLPNVTQPSYTQLVLADGASSMVEGSYETCVQMWGAAL